MENPIMNELKYPFDSDFILKRRKSIRKSLYFMCEGKPLITKRIAILGGSTTHDIKEILGTFFARFWYQAEIL